MKKIISFIVLALAAGVPTALSQGTITFANRAGTSTTAAPGQVYAPIYREDPNDPTHRISGNTAAGIPAGSTSYNGAPVVAAGQQDHTWVATLWGRLSTEVSGDGANNNLVLLENGTTTFSTATSGTFAGIVIRPSQDVPVPGVLNDSQRGTFQVRVWDTRNGAITAWDQVMLPENNNVLRGYSDLLTDPYPLGNSQAPPNAAPYLQGLQSFNLFIVPEPSVLVLGIPGAAFLLFVRSRRRKPSRRQTGAPLCPLRIVMRRAGCIWTLLAFAENVFGQGTVIFSNRSGSTSTAAPGRVVAPIYREDPNDPTHRISGNTPTGVPSGSTSYNGAAFVAAGQGSTLTATLWALNAPVTGDAANNNLQPVLINGTAAFGTATSGTFAGIWVQPIHPAVVPNATQSTDRPTFQVRVWDTRAGAIATWDQLMMPQNDNVLRGYSDLFAVPFSLGDTQVPPGVPPCLQGLQSFNLFIVPEPSALLLSAIGAAALLFLVRKRK